jgi:hypothetical protein
VADFEDNARADEADVSERIDRYADELRAAGAIQSPQVERAFRTVQRHRMLETFYYRDAGGRVTVHHDPGHPRRDHLELIYADTALATRYIGGMPASSTSQASLVARMLELLGVLGPAGSRAQQRPGWLGHRGPHGIRWWKDAALAGELDRHYRDWDARGRPVVGDYQVSFLPIGTEGDPPPGGWQINRRFHRELVTLGVRPESPQGTGARAEDRSA